MMTLQKFNPALLAVLLAALCFCGGTEGRTPETAEEELGPKIPFEGTIVFHSNFDGDNEIYALGGGELIRLTDNDWNDEFPVWSPDGQRIAFTSDRSGGYDIYTMAADGSDQMRRTDHPADEKDPAWLHDGSGLVYSREFKRLVGKKIQLFRTDLETGKTVRMIPGYEGTHAIPHLSPDGSKITMTVKKTRGWDGAVYDLETGGMVLLGEKGKSCRGRFSKDGRRLAYVSSEEDGKGDIWLAGADGKNKTRLTIRDDTYDYFPAWSPDGRFVVFNSSTQHDHNGDWALYIIDVKTGEARLLFDSPGNDVFPDWR